MASNVFKRAFITAPCLKMDFKVRLQLRLRHYLAVGPGINYAVSEEKRVLS